MAFDAHLLFLHTYKVIREVHQLGLELRVTAYRPSDHKIATSTFEFSYMEHEADVEVKCSNCSVLTEVRALNRSSMLLIIIAVLLDDLLPVRRQACIRLILFYNCLRLFPSREEMTADCFMPKSIVS